MKTDKPENEKQTSTPKEVNPNILGILGNALSSTIKNQNISAGTETRRCLNCSAARPADTDLQFCSYCNYKFY